MAYNFLDKTGLALVWEKIKNLAAGKVDKVEGKGLSTNDYTDAEQLKLSGISSGAQENVLEGIQKNGTTVAITNKIANISVPTATSELTNDSGFITSADVPDGAAASTSVPLMDGTAAVGTSTAFARGDHVHPSDTSRQEKITASGLLKGNGSGGVSAAVAGTDFQSPLTFDSTPTSGSGNPITSGAVYTAIQSLGSALKYKGTKATTSALPSTGNETGDVWHVTADGGEYVWNGSSWEELGSAVDLSGYVEDTDMVAITSTEINTICV